MGDLHGRFHRVQDWLSALESARGRAAGLVLAVGDVEAFGTADDHRRKASKRAMPAEYAEYAEGKRGLRWPIHFIGGNNEDFVTLRRMPSGGELPGGLRYLGRSGVVELGGLQLAFLSGIYAPKHFELPVAEPRTRETLKQAGYFRKSDLVALEGVRGVPLMLAHEWPRGIISRGKGGRVLRARRFPWIGNPVTRSLVERVRPKWLLCGHSHVSYAATLGQPEGEVRIACLDQTAQPAGSVFWLEYERGEAVRSGWGVTGEVAWRAGQLWGEEQVPAEAAMQSGAE
ncbi:MAG: metallophosphoesterase [Myxococcales bacterium]|nr:metallophosphoesterase [Myxococcales bacterium]